MTHSTVTENQEYSHEELDNLSSNITKKMNTLGLSLPELAKEIGMEYQTLWRIAYRRDDYVPSLRVLFPIAEFFNVTIGDLLKNGNVPQYVPLIEVGDTHQYLFATVPYNPSPSTSVLCTEYVHQKAFAIKVNIGYLGTTLPITCICKPFNKITKDSYIIFNISKNEHYFVKVNNIEDNKLTGTCLLKNTELVFDIDKITPLAVAVKQTAEHSLI